MKIRGGYILYLLILCAVVGCKGTSSPSTASETDKYAGTRKEIFEGGYLKPGEQYLQLRYLPGEVK